MNGKKARYLRRLSSQQDPSITSHIDRGGQLINVHNKYTLTSSLFYRLFNYFGQQLLARYRKAKKLKKSYMYLIRRIQKIKNWFIPTKLVKCQNFCLGNRSTYKALKALYIRKETLPMLNKKQLLEKGVKEYGKR